MLGLFPKSKESIGKSVEEMFDNIALQFIGNIPKLKEKKRLVISSQPHYGLAHLFVQSMGNKPLNEIEKDVLKSLLESANGYIDSLKHRTISNVVEGLDGLAREANIQKRKISNEEINELLSAELDKAKSHLKLVAESESTKIRNLGRVTSIARVSSSLGESDPTVYFQVVHDNLLCNDCKRLHLMDDSVTPRLWKMSELKAGYGKRGDDRPSQINRHPSCRCFLTLLTKGFGFKNGKLTYIKQNFDALDHQRKI